MFRAIWFKGIPVRDFESGGRNLTCNNCGTALDDNAQFCSNCGTLTKQPQFAATPPAASVPSYPPPIAYPPQTSGKAVASLVCGIINVFPFCVIAVILGHISLSQIKKSAGRLKGEGLAIAGLIFGYLGLVSIPVILIVAAIAIPNLLRAKIAANESSAVGSVRNIVLAEMTYQSNNPTVGFTCSLSDLSAAGLIDSTLAGGQRHGYSFSLQNCVAGNEGGPVSKFQLTATPLTYKTTGFGAFCADETNAVRVDREGSAQNCVDHGTALE
jgi:type II secretory pathway pseudopilin PulG